MIEVGGIQPPHKETKIHCIVICVACEKMQSAVGGLTQKENTAGAPPQSIIKCYFKQRTLDRPKFAINYHRSRNQNVTLYTRQMKISSSNSDRS